MDYTVQPGDTLYKIANQFETTVQQLAELNDIEDPDFLEVGQTLLIPNGTELKKSDYEIANGLLLILFTDKDSYQPGQTIGLNLVKVNIGNSPIELNYNTSQRVDFIARRFGQQVWQWSRGRNFAQVIGKVELAPGEASVYQESWNQRSNEGQQVESGIYQIIGWNVAREIERERLNISIKIE